MWGGGGEVQLGTITAWNKFGNVAINIKTNQKITNSQKKQLMIERCVCTYIPGEHLGKVTWRMIPTTPPGLPRWIPKSWYRDDRMLCPIDYRLQRMLTPCEPLTTSFHARCLLPKWQTITRNTVRRGLDLCSRAKGRVLLLSILKGFENRNIDIREKRLTSAR